MSLKHVHIIGVGGTLMGAFATYLKRSGVRVTGSDLNIYPPMSDVLRNAGVEIFCPYSADNLEAIGSRPDLVVVGNVISRGNPEMSAFETRGDVTLSLPEFMEKRLLGSTRNLVVAGTHGKTTTSSLLAFVLRECGWSPSFFIGGVSKNLPHSFHVETESKYERVFVLEGDEYDTAFWDKVPKFNHYLPNDVILTSVEFDHADIYADLNAVKAAFFGLMDRIRSGGRVIACIETDSVREVIARSKVKVITYAREGVAHNVDFTVGLVRPSNQVAGGIQFQISEAGKVVETLHLALTGEHNALNAAAVWIECRELGMESEQVKLALSRFQGIKRRQEEVAEVKGVMVVDDFAHHPTAVRETLKALRLKYGNRRLVTVFEPRSATSRRKVFQKEYTEAFDLADQIWIAAAFDQSKIPQDQQFSCQELVAGLKSRGRDAHFFESIPDQVKILAKQAHPGDVMVVLSNGGFGGFIPKLIEALRS